MRPRAIPRPRLSQGRLNVSIVGRPNHADALDRRGAGERYPGTRGFERRTVLSGAAPSSRAARASSSEEQKGPRNHAGRTSEVRWRTGTATRRDTVIGRRPPWRNGRRGSEGPKAHTKLESAPRGPTCRLRPEIRRDYPLNLSILISGGKETNQDSPSNGE